jgi:ribosomal protein S18 acetylase RimI-like enzyme
LAVNVRALSSDDWPLLRSLRLRALQESPNAFGETYREASQRAEVDWQRITMAIVENGNERSFLAFDGSVPCGLTYCRRLEEPAETVQVGAMWVDPSHRRQHFGQAMLNAAMNWAREMEAERVQLWVTEGNEPAINFYQTAGFRDSGERGTLREGSSMTTWLMVCELEL